MTDVAATQSSVGTTSVTSTTSATADAERLVSSDFETFLKMMTAQVQNQDPLNPMDSSEYASQLATFSSVEQQVLTNDLLRNLGDMLGGNALQQYGSWVGMDALARVPAEFTGNPIVVRPDYEPNADSAIVAVRNSAGEVVQRLSIPVGQEEVLWAGYDDQQNALPDDVYRFEIESYQNGELTGTTLASVYTRVEEIRNQGTSVVVRLAGGIEVESTQVNGLRSAQS
ncbi:flagellar basal body rod modification protein [Pelagimonas phthalicica]|uniref:Basal-body rod modification protein FlgD n=1 Tax=Pelagimonas phthalicica TaxID=1037362 RepID=A0A238J654_9RHOB|nr:flagellar hook capping FlgD N-terminal domain-containing protein [Pelagimonas phthalicica]TDS95358.1 flagellar basal-body rod modification protein FlgD [Pelagimonas phthalicica]SMX26118.1 flagellar basal body rod modification protein [Pelagimonas phthalicica]